MKIAVLTSSRADYGIYLPLLKRINADSTIELTIIAFGSHCSNKFGHTVETIENDGFQVHFKINDLLDGDSPLDIAKSYANTVRLFSEFWSEHSNFNWVFALGDRFEMAAAVNAGIPFGINIAHIHGGETTLGAIDNIYRHQITLASKLHFVSTDNYAKRVNEIIGKEGVAQTVGSLSLENIQQFNFLSAEEFKQKWDIDLTIPTILMTIHPETVGYEMNFKHILELKQAIPEMLNSHQLVITLPNADTFGSLYRNFFIELQSEFPHRVILIESFGSQAYFTCMKNADLVVGNSSSGIIEAASFNKYVINLGNRQEGRATSDNVITVPFVSAEILSMFDNVKGKVFTGENIYFRKDVSLKIVDRLKQTL